MSTDLKNKQTSSTILSKPDEVTAEIVKSVPVDKALTGLEPIRDSVRRGLAEVGGESGRELLATWDAISSYVDANDHIRFNLDLIQTHLVEHQNRYWEMKKHNQEKLDEAFEKLPEEMAAYQALQKLVSEEEAQAHHHTMDLVKVANQTAKEYRACAMQKDYMVHITRFTEYKFMIASLLQRHVHDQIILDNIADDMRMEGQALFPISRAVDIGVKDA